MMLCANESRRCSSLMTSADVSYKKLSKIYKLLAPKCSMAKIAYTLMEKKTKNIIKEKTADGVTDTSTEVHSFLVLPD